MKKPNILVFVGSYLPGTKSAGVTTSLYNMCRHLKDYVNFYILTEDRDIGDTEPYDNVPLEQWTKYEDANVYYSRRYLKSLSELRRIMRSVDFDAYYINGFYNISDNLRPMLLHFLRLVPQKKLIIAPRGIFSLGKYNNRIFARAVYRFLFSMSGLLKRSCWHATADLERDHILNRFSSADVRILPNISDIPVADRPADLHKSPGSIRILFISRISEKKNIKFIIDSLNHIKGNVEMNFYGMIGTQADKCYWEECLELIQTLPDNIVCRYRGVVDKKDIQQVFQSHHLFFFPTFGENYGHVIAESLAFGCPLILSDNTPWNMLDKYGAGWNIPLDKPEEYIRQVQRVVDMDAEQWRLMSDNAIRCAKDYLDTDTLITKYISFFESV